MTTKQDLLDKIEGVKVFTEGGLFGPTNYILGMIGGTRIIVENDFITLGDNTFIFKEVPEEASEGIYEVQLDLDFGTSFDNLIQALSSLNITDYSLSATFMFMSITRVDNDVPLPLLSFTNFILSNNNDTFINLMEILDNVLEGNTLTIGDITYTFKETPIEPFDIQIGDFENTTETYFINFLTNTPNSDAYTVITEGIILLKPTIYNTTINTNEIKYYEISLQAGIKTFDVDKLNIIKSNFLFQSYTLPTVSRNGTIIRFINISGNDIFVGIRGMLNIQSIRFNNPMWFNFIYLNDTGWHGIVGDKLYPFIQVSEALNY